MYWDYEIFKSITKIYFRLNSIIVPMITWGLILVSNILQSKCNMNYSVFQKIKTKTNSIQIWTASSFIAKLRALSVIHGAYCLNSTLRESPRESYE